MENLIENLQYWRNNGFGIIAPGEERFLHVFNQDLNEYEFHYGYRIFNGPIFFCIEKSLVECRKRKNFYLKSFVNDINIYPENFQYVEILRGSIWELLKIDSKFVINFEQAIEFILNKNVFTDIRQGSIIYSNKLNSHILIPGGE